MPLNTVTLFPFCIRELTAGESAGWTDRSGWFQFATLQDLMDLWYFAKTWTVEIDAEVEADALELAWDGFAYNGVGPVTRTSPSPQTLTLNSIAVTAVEDFACADQLYFNGTTSSTDFDYAADLTLGVESPIPAVGDYRIVFDSVDSSYWLTYYFQYSITASAALYAEWSPLSTLGSTFYVGNTAYTLGVMDALWISPGLTDDGDIDIYGYTVDISITGITNATWTSGTVDVATTWTY